MQVDLPSILTQNNGQKRPIFVTPCILPSHTGFKKHLYLKYLNTKCYVFKTCHDYVWTWEKSCDSTHNSQSTLDDNNLDKKEFEGSHRWAHSQKYIIIFGYNLDILAIVGEEGERKLLIEFRTGHATFV